MASAAAPRRLRLRFITGSDLLMDGGVIAALPAGRIELAADVGVQQES